MFLYLLFSHPHDLGASSACRGISWRDSHPDLLCGGPPRLPQLLGEGRRDDPPGRPLHRDPGARHPAVQGRQQNQQIISLASESLSDKNQLCNWRGALPKKN